MVGEPLFKHRRSQRFKSALMPMFDGRTPGIERPESVVRLSNRCISAVDAPKSAGDIGNGPTARLNLLVNSSALPIR